MTELIELLIKSQQDRRIALVLLITSTDKALMSAWLDAGLPEIPGDSREEFLVDFRMAALGLLAPSPAGSAS